MTTARLVAWVRPWCPLVGRVGGAFRLVGAGGTVARRPVRILRPTIVPWQVSMPMVAPSPGAVGGLLHHKGSAVSTAGPEERT
jgi:hypothetical protein